MYRVHTTYVDHQSTRKKMYKIAGPYIKLYALFLKSPLTVSQRMQTSRGIWGISREEIEVHAILLYTCKLLVIVIPERVSLSEIRRCFLIYGEVIRVRLMRQFHTMRTTYGKVVLLSFRRSESTASALQCSSYILGRWVQVFEH